MPRHSALFRTAAAIVYVRASTATGQATEPFEGRWAETPRECRGEIDGPSSRTEIDLQRRERGKPAPLFDQYENHCRITASTRGGAETVLKLTCFDFWEDYNKGTNGHKVTVRLRPRSGERLDIDGAHYVRCGHGK